MKLETAIRLRIIAAFSVVLVLLVVYWPPYGILLSIIWLAIVIWQAVKQGTLKK